MPALVALGALALYSAGIFTTMGQLAASGVDVAEGLALMPLDRHLRTGLRLVGDAEAWFLLAFAGIMYATVASAERRAVKPKTPTSSRTPKAHLLACAVVPVLFMVATPWPYVVKILLTALGISIFVAVRRTTWAFRELALAVRELTLAILVIYIAAGSAFDALVDSRDLPLATLEHRGEQITGPYIGQSDGALYLGADHATYRIVPLAAASNLRVTKATRPPTKDTVLELLGL